MSATIGPLVDQVNAGVTVPDLTFEGPRLLGWTGLSFAVIDSITGRVTPYTAQTSIGGGLGLASIAPGTLLGIPTQPAQGASATSPAQIAPASPRPVNGTGQVGAQTPREPMLRIGGRSLARHEVLALARDVTDGGRVRRIIALARDVTDGGRVRRIIPLAALAALGLGDRVVLVAASGATRVVALGAPGLALAVNHRQELKLIDTHEGFHQIFAAIVEIRDLTHR